MSLWSVDARVWPRFWAARTLLTVLAPGGDRGVGPVQLLGRRVHQADHPLVLSVELPVVEPAHPQPVPQTERQGPQTAGVRDGQQDRQVVIRIDGDPDLVVGPVCLP